MDIDISAQPLDGVWLAQSEYDDLLSEIEYLQEENADLSARLASVGETG